MTRSGTPAPRVLLDRRIGSPEELAEIAVELAPRLEAGDLLVLTGPLGAGKTTFTRALGERLGVRGAVTSPTFVLARTHPSLSGGAALVHVDAYRLGSAAELDDLDLDYEGSIVVVEWGAGLLDGVSDSWLEIVLERSDADALAEAPEADAASAEEDRAEPRRVTVSGFGPRWAE